MLQTVEMRWFFETCPLDAAVHFEGDRADATEFQHRTDWYSMPCNPRSGTKVREGKLESKLLSESFGLREYPSLTGLLEAWQKWSLEFPSDDYPTEAQLQSAGWIAVEKMRRLQRYAVTEGQTQMVSTRPVNGCEFEMTQLNVNGGTFWTCGFEAVGSPENLEANLQTVAHEVTTRGGLLAKFDQDNSYGYAQWLSQLPQ